MDNKARIILFVVGLCTIALIGSSAYLQIFDKSYRIAAKKTTLNKSTLYPSRGLVYDRKGRLLINNSPIYDIQCIYNNVPEDIDTTAFCKLLGIDKEMFKTRINKDWSSVRYNKRIPFVFLEKVKPEQFAVFQEHLYKYPGFYPVERNIRHYTHQNAAHVMGFMGEVNNRDLKKKDNFNYTGGDYIGKSGIELTYEKELRGKKGVKYDLKDNLGRVVSSYENGKLDSAAVSGATITTSLDLELQKYAEQLMQGKRGAIVAIEPSTGEILTMLSAPTYDPNLLNLDRSRGIAYDSLQRDSINKPLFDRPVSAKYPPGSIFKTIMSLIAMQKGVLDPNRTIHCDGVYEVDSRGRYKQKCHHHPTPYNVSIAIQHSCNSYYYQTFREFINSFGVKTPWVGLDTLNANLNDFGLGKTLGIDYQIENPGFLPTPAFYEKQYKKSWRSTYVLSLGIGQGEYQFTTMQMANLAAILANRGHYYTPHLVKNIENGSFKINPKFEEKHRVRIDRKYFDPVIKGMSKVASDGTAKLAFIPDIPLAGKTGTSQNPHGKDHSVFFAFAPVENPKIAIAVFVENAGFGGTTAAPIASLMIEKYLHDSIAPRRKWLEDFIYKQDLYKE